MTELDMDALEPLDEQDVKSFTEQIVMTDEENQEFDVTNERSMKYVDEVPVYLYDAVVRAEELVADQDLTQSHASSEIAEEITGMLPFSTDEGNSIMRVLHDLEELNALCADGHEDYVEAFTQWVAAESSTHERGVATLKSMVCRSIEQVIFESIREDKTTTPST